MDFPWDKHSKSLMRKIGVYRNHLKEGRTLFKVARKMEVYKNYIK